MKKTLIIVLIVGLLVAGYYMFMKKEVVPVKNTSNAKINVDAVCQGALAYMTFPDAAAAEVFVGECKEGKHPEVIEKYKADMNLGDGAAI